ARQHRIPYRDGTRLNIPIRHQREGGTAVPVTGCAAGIDDPRDLTIPRHGVLAEIVRSQHHAANGKRTHHDHLGDATTHDGPLFCGWTRMSKCAVLTTPAR